MRLTKKGFRAWLEMQSPRKVVAMPGYGSGECPLARYLKSSGCEYATVHPYHGHMTGGTYSTDCRTWKLPVWANRFADECGGLDALEHRITVARALKILDEDSP